MTVENVAHKMSTVLQIQGYGFRKLNMNQERLTNPTEFLELTVNVGLIMKSISRARFIIYRINFVLWYADFQFR